jgi:hypothetical protein
MHNGHQTNITFSKEITKGRNPWIWDAESGERYRINLKDGVFSLALGPAQSCIVVFSNDKNGQAWSPVPAAGTENVTLSNGWDVELRHSREDWVKTTRMDELKDLKDTDLSILPVRLFTNKPLRSGRLNRFT